MNLHLVSWNVLNQRYMKYILNDSQGLKGSNICSQSEEERTDDICGKVMQIIQKEELERRVGIVCLQECWPALLNRLRGRMPSRLELLRADEEVRNQEAQLETWGKHEKRGRLRGSTKQLCIYIYIHTYARACSLQQAMFQ